MGQGEQARDHFTTATTMYREMDMTYWLETVEAEMRQLGAASGRCAQVVDLAGGDHGAKVLRRSQTLRARWERRIWTPGTQRRPPSGSAPALQPLPRHRGSSR